MTKILPSEHHTIWIREYNLCFVYIPKVACTSWKIFLWKIMGGEIQEGSGYTKIHDPDQIRLPYLYKIEESQRKELADNLEEGKTKIMAIVRDPYSRLISAYLNKIKNHENQNSKFTRQIIPSIQDFAELDRSIRPSFSDFIYWLEQSKSKHVQNDHWLPMTNILKWNPENINKFELCSIKNMKKAITIAREKSGKNINFPDNNYLGARRNNKSENKVVAVINDDCKEIIRKQYELDFEMMEHIAD